VGTLRPSGPIKSINPKLRLITVTVRGTDLSWEVTADATIRVGEATALKDLKPKTAVTLTLNAEGKVTKVRGPGRDLFDAPEIQMELANKVVLVVPKAAQPPNLADFA
jgi:hypothetical protein